MNPIARPPTKRQMIKDRVVRWIREQELAPGEKIMSQNELADHFQTTAVTVHKALTELAEEGILHRRRGAGTFVGPAAGAVQTREICYILPGEHLESPADNPNYWPYMQTILRNFFACARPGWHLSTRSVPPGTDAAAVVESLAETDLVLFHYTQEPRELLQELIAARRQAVASLGLPRPDLDCLTVDHDRTAGARAGVEHLLHLGYRRVAFVGSVEYWGDLSFAGYAEALAAYGQAVDPARVVRTGEPREEGLRAATVLDGRGTDFDAVFVDSDSRALGVLEGLRRTGRRVPTEVGVMGYDGLDAAVYHPPHLTSVAIPYQPMLRAALEAAAENDFAPTPRRHLEFVGRVVAGRTAVAQDSGEMAS